MIFTRKFEERGIETTKVIRRKLLPTSIWPGVPNQHKHKTMDQSVRQHRPRRDPQTEVTHDFV